MGWELNIGYEDTSISLLYHEFSFKELKLFLELYVSYVTCDLAFDIDRMLKCSSPCAYLEKQLLEFMWLLFCGKKMNGCQVGANMVKAIKDWLISKSAFEERSFHGLPNSLIVVTKKMIRFTGETCSPHLEFAHNFTILYSSFEVDYDHTLSLGGNKTMEIVKYIIFKDHDAIDVNNMKFEMERLVMVGPASTVAGRLLPAPSLEDVTYRGW
ncbi:hypothetical protein M9H77_26719 [Catharanthus roseus]|uniref:Uncharacterized protein n=1 Tax=Catharanthus roseus TaxID=4058 RepID=A0ACC0AAY5_CATRO|nr:hypothetical protein M9H77_26719 [Catharanthus roseus]